MVVACTLPTSRHRPPACRQELHEQVMEMRNTIQQLRMELESRPTSARYEALIAEVRLPAPPLNARSLAPPARRPCDSSHARPPLVGACACSVTS